MVGGQSWEPDRAIALDWSASSRPVIGANSIWIGAASSDDETEVRNIATRREAERVLENEVRESLAAGRRLLIGCDAGLGYPAGSAAVFGALERSHSAPVEPWRAMWTLIEADLVDDDLNRNNRFDVAARLNAAARQRGAQAGPFWGAPAAAAGPNLTRTKPARAASGRPAEFRLAELVLRAAGRRPHSMWQLMGAGSVGSQSLTLIPVIERLRRAHPGSVAVWPFDIDRIGSGTASVVVAEMWPTMFGFDEEIATRSCRDAAQVHRMAEVALAESGDWLAVPANPPPSTIDEEGWVLGVPWPEGVDPSPDSAVSS